MLSAKVQAHVEQRLKSHELTEAFATNEFVWFAVFVFNFLPERIIDITFFYLSPLLITQNLFIQASALLALPIFFAYRVLSSLFW